MSDYISIHEAIAKINERAREKFSLDAEYEYYLEALNDIMDDLVQLSTIEAVPVKHGEWIYTKKRLARGGYVDASECSICHKLIMPHLKPNYCPNCGAKMDGGKDDENMR